MIRALIVDDEPLARQRIAQLLQHHPDVEIAGECADGESAVARLSEDGIDLVFLDVQMPKLDGLSVPALLPPDCLPVIIFVTAYDAYALRAFEAHALDYLVKPVHPERFDHTLARARTYIRGRGQHEPLQRLVRDLNGGPYRQRMAVRDRNRIVIVRVDDIQWTEAQGNYIRIHTASGSHLTRESLRQFVGTTDPARFVRVHRSAVVNVDSVRELRLDRERRLQIVLANGHVVPVGLAYRVAVEAAFGIAG